MEDLNKVLLDIARDVCFRLLQTFNGKIEELRKRPMSNRELRQFQVIYFQRAFQSYQVMYEEEEEQKKALFKEVTDLDDMYELLLAQQQKANEFPVLYIERVC